jgi:hypothetical protein
MPQGHVSAAQRGKRERGRQHVDLARRARLRRGIAARRPRQHGVAANGEGVVANCDHGAVRQLLGAQAVAPLRPPVEPLDMELRIDFGEAQAGGGRRLERPRGGAPALAAGAMAGGKGRDLVDKEQFSIACSPDLAMAAP